MAWLAAAAPDAQKPAGDVRDALLRADDARVTTAEQRKTVDEALSASVAASADKASRTPEVRAQALRTIARTRRAEFLPRAIEALAHPSLDVRREAAFAVAHIGSGAPDAFAAAERALRDALGTETDLLVAAALAEEYGRLPFASRDDVDGAARALQSLLTRLSRNGTTPQFVVLGVARGAEALSRRAIRLEAKPSTESSAADVTTLLDLLYSSQRATDNARPDVLGARIRRLAVMGLVALDRLKEARLQSALGDTDAQVRRLGVVALARGAVTSEQAQQLLRDEAVIVRHAVASRVGAKLPEIAEAATKDAHVNVRTAALDALGESGACRDSCSSRLDRPNAFETAWHEAAHALVALARSDADAARPHVTRAASAEVWQVRMYAARAAAFTRQADVITRLAADSNVNVRHAALVAWRESGQPGLDVAAVAALASDDGQLLLEAVRALRPGSGIRDSTSEDREPGTGKREPGSHGVPGTGLAPGAGYRVPGTVSRTDVVSALRSTLARVTALKRETSRDPRVALIELLAEIDEDRAATLQPYLTDFDPFIVERMATLLKVPAPPGSAGLARAPVPSWSDVQSMSRTTIAFQLRGGKTLTLRLYAENAPTAVARLLRQVRAGEWNGRTFHRVEPGFVVQGGSPSANEYAGAAAFARDEFSALSHVRGTVGISTRGADTGDGQIFINLVDNARLDFAYTIVGSIVGDPSPIDDIVEGEIIESATADVQPPAQ